MPVFVVICDGQERFITSDYNYACECIDHYKRKLGRLHNICHVEVKLINQ